MSLNRDHVINTLRRQNDTLRNMGVARLGLFGSAARNEASNQSDLDFVLDLQEDSFDSYMAVLNFLEDLFGCKVDLVLANSIKPALKDRIQRETVNVA